MGVTKEILKAGNGSKPSPGQSVTVHCTGYGKNRDLSKVFWCELEVVVDVVVYVYAVAVLVVVVVVYSRPFYVICSNPFCFHSCLRNVNSYLCYFILFYFI